MTLRKNNLDKFKWCVDKIQAKSVLDVLATVAGVDISANGGRGQNSSVYMRGGNSDHTLVLLNGVRIGL